MLGALAFAQYYGPSSIQDPGTGRRAVRAPQSEIGVDQKLNDYVPMDAVFTDSDGRKVQLRELFKGRPVVLMPLFFACPGVCTLELDNMVEALRGFRSDFVGRDFDVLTVSIKPTEGPEAAKARKDQILDKYDRRGAEEGWHFVTGSLDQIRRLTDSIGFRFTYDSEADAIVHPACVVILTPEGQVSRYFLETDYPQQELLDTIKSAAKGRIGRKVDSDSIWNCIHIDPLTGQRSLNIMKVLDLAAIFTLLALAVSVVFMTLKYRTTALSAEKKADGGEEKE